MCKSSKRWVDEKDSGRSRRFQFVGGEGATENSRTCPISSVSRRTMSALAIAGVNFECFFTCSIGDSDETFTVIKPLRETIARAITFTVLKDWRPSQFAIVKGLPRYCYGLTHDHLVLGANSCRYADALTNFRCRWMRGLRNSTSTWFSVSFSKVINEQVRASVCRRSVYHPFVPNGNSKCPDACGVERPHR